MLTSTPARMLSLSLAAALVATAACSSSDSTSDEAVATSDAGTNDSSTTVDDAALPADAASTTDTGATITAGLVISASTANTATQNGSFSGTTFAVKYPASDAGAGQVNVGIGAAAHSVEFNCDIFMLTAASGTTFDVATSKEIHCSFLENGKLFLADSGTLVVTTLSETDAKIGFTNVHYTAVPPFMMGEPTPTGSFVVNGSIASPVTVFSM